MSKHRSLCLHSVTMSVAIQSGNKLPRDFNGENLIQVSSNYNEVLLATTGMQCWKPPLPLRAEAAQPREEQIRKRGSHSPGLGSSHHGPRDVVFPETTCRWDSLGGLTCTVPGKVPYGRCPAVEAAGNQPLVRVMCQEVALGGGRSRLPTGRVLPQKRSFSVSPAPSTGEALHGAPWPQAGPWWLSLGLGGNQTLEDWHRG